MLQSLAEQITYHIAFTREIEASCGIRGRARVSLAGDDYEVGKDTKQLPRTAA